MFHRGVLHSYDPALKAGIIKINDHDFDVHFILNDMANSSIAPQIGERVKCIVVDKDDQRHAKFIVRLDNKHARVEQPLNQLFYRAHEDLEGESKKFEQELDELIEKRLADQESMFDSQTQIQDFELNFNTLSKESIVLDGSGAEHHADQVSDPATKISLGEPLEEEQIKEMLESKPSRRVPVLNESAVVPLTKVQPLNESAPEENVDDHLPEPTHAKGRPPKVVRKEVPDVKTHFQLKFNAQKFITSSRVDEFGTDKKSKKKPKKIKDPNKQFNPWIFASIVPILVFINLGVWGFQKYEQYREEQDAKAKIYAVEQEHIIKEQKKEAEK